MFSSPQSPLPSITPEDKARKPVQNTVMENHAEIVATKGSPQAIYTDLHTNCCRSAKRT